MDQEVKYINIKDLVLWTENPRDPINETVSDQYIVDRALSDNLNKWSLKKLSKEMGDYYDFSELPTVVFHAEKPVVYDGNRRIILGKIKHKLVTVQGQESIKIPKFPEEIPCNVCTKEIALNNIFRKHNDTGSWLPLERDMFLYKYLRKEKSPFLLLEEETGIISANPHLNQRFVKEEIFKKEILKLMGFFEKNGQLFSVHSDIEGYSILSDISRKIENKTITTRKNRGKVTEVLDPSSQNLIDQNKKNEQCRSHITFDKSNNKSTSKTKRQSRRTPDKKAEMFGGVLYLYIGGVNNLYKDIVALYKFYIREKKQLSDTFPNLIRMSLRLLCETAAKDCGNMKLDTYLKNNFENAKKQLDKNVKTTLSNKNISESSIVQLLQTGAHNYTSSGDLDQTIALSMIIGEILTITCGKDK